jgi:glutamate-1-semialdehyde 2,1-aminomutase
MLAPLGPVYQAGTLSGNPLAMAAGRATLEYLYKHSDEIYPQLERLSGALVDGVVVAAHEAGVTVTANRVGSMFTWFFTDGPVTDFASAATSDTHKFATWHSSMIEAAVGAMREVGAK